MHVGEGVGDKVTVTRRARGKGEAETADRARQVSTYPSFRQVGTSLLGDATPSPDKLLSSLQLSLVVCAPPARRSVGVRGADGSRTPKAVRRRSRTRSSRPVQRRANAATSASSLRDRPALQKAARAAAGGGARNHTSSPQHHVAGGMVGGRARSRGSWGPHPRPRALRDRGQAPARDRPAPEGARWPRAGT